MRKALLPMLASLLICGAATAAMLATNANAGQNTHKPLMLLAQNQPVPPAEREAGPRPPDMDGQMRGRGEMCENLYALKAGEIAFLEAKLKLTAGQQPLFARCKTVSLDIAKRHEGDCGTRLERLRAGQRP